MGSLIGKSTIDLKECVKEHGGIRAASRFLGVDHTTLQSRFDQEGITYDAIMWEYQQEIAPKQIAPEGISGDVVITADWHIPFVSLEWLERVIRVGREENIKQLLVAGDFFDFDRLSWWLKKANAEDIAVPFGDELSLAEMVLEKLESQYDKIYMVGGNHWKRLVEKVTYSISDTKLMGLVGRKDDPRYVYSGQFEWTLIDGKVRVTHPHKARKLDYTLARDLAILYPEQWLVVAHRHRVNEGFTPDGRPMLEIGWIGDTERMRYVQHIDSTYYKWINGFAMWKDGCLKNFTPYNYNWSKQNDTVAGE